MYRGDKHKNNSIQSTDIFAKHFYTLVLKLFLLLCSYIFLPFPFLFDDTAHSNYLFLVGTLRGTRQYINPKSTGQEPQIILSVLCNFIIYILQSPRFQASSSIILPPSKWEAKFWQCKQNYLLAFSPWSLQVGSLKSAVFPNSFQNGLAVKGRITLVTLLTASFNDVSSNIQVKEQRWEVSASMTATLPWRGGLLALVNRRSMLART